MYKLYDRVLDTVTGKPCFVFDIDDRGPEGLFYGLIIENQDDQGCYRWAEHSELRKLPEGKLSEKELAEFLAEGASCENRPPDNDEFSRYASMISIEEFKEIYDLIPGEPKFELWFGNERPTYMIIKYADHASFQRTDFNASLRCSGEIDHPSLDSLLSADLIDGINLRRDWEEVRDIIACGTWSLCFEDDRDDLRQVYCQE